MVTASEYNRWVASAKTDEALIETIEVSHSSFPTQWFANWDRDITATLETTPGGGGQQAFKAARFHLEPSETSDGTAQGTTLVISSVDGLLYEYFADMDFMDRMDPVTITTRLYLSQTLTVPVYTTPPVWTLHSIVASWDTLQGDLQATPLRIQRIGRYYTVIELPVFKYVR